MIHVLIHLSATLFSRLEIPPSFSFSRQILKGLSPVRGRPGEHLPPMNFVQLKDELVEKHGGSAGLPISDTDVMSAALYPKVCDDYINFREDFGPVSLFDTRIFLQGPKVGEEIEVSSFFSCVPEEFHPLLLIYSSFVYSLGRD